MRRPRTTNTALLTACISVLAAARPVGAAEPAGEPTALDEIVVTATKRSESVQSVPIAVSAFGTDQLAALGVRNTQDLFDRVPSADFQLNNGSTAANFYLRGIGSKGPAANNVSAVGIYADEVSISSPVVNVLQVFDLERVEVLRGPQNTLYGRNTTGGAVNFISRKPTIGEGTTGYATLTGGRYSQFDAEGALGWDVGERTAARLSFQRQVRDPVYTNASNGTEAYDRDIVAGRLQVRYAPTDAVDVLLKGHLERVDNINKLWKMIGLQAPVPVNGLYTTPCTSAVVLGGACVSLNGQPTDPDDFTTFNASLARPIEKVDAGGGSVYVTWDTGPVTLTSITAYETTRSKKAEDVDAGRQPVRPTGPFPTTGAGVQGGFDFFQDASSRQWSQELRVTSPSNQAVRWIGGAFALSNDTEESTTAFPYFTGRVNSTRLMQQNRIYSAYGETELDFAERWTATLGLRYTNEKVEGTNTTVQRLLSNATVAAALLPTNGQRPPRTLDLVPLPSGRSPYLGAPYGETWTDWGGTAGLRFRASDTLMFYGSLSRGFKAGAFSAAPAQSLNGSFYNNTDPEYLTAYEVGMKSELLDRSLRLNLSAYYYDFKDQQLQRITSFPGLGIVAVTDNAGKSRLYGLELETQWAPGNGWTVNLNAGWLDSEIKEFKQDQACAPAGVGSCPAAGFFTIDFAGNELINAPKATANLAIRKSWDVSGTLALFAGGDVSYKGARWFNLPNDPLTRDDSYTIANVSAGARFGANQNYELTIWSKNVTNELFFLNKSVFTATGTMEALISDPRTYGVTLTARF